jgi:hypothetical protein
MAKFIQTGIDRTVEALSNQQREGKAAQWRELRNKMDSLLLSTNIFKTDDIRRVCLALDTMSPTDRVEYIKQKWGPLYLERVQPILQQLQALEEIMSREAKENKDET